MGFKEVQREVIKHWSFYDALRINSKDCCEEYEFFTGFIGDTLLRKTNFVGNGVLENGHKMRIKNLIITINGNLKDINRIKQHFYNSDFKIIKPGYIGWDFCLADHTKFDDLSIDDTIYLMYTYHDLGNIKLNPLEYFRVLYIPEKTWNGDRNYGIKVDLVGDLERLN